MSWRSPGSSGGGGAVASVFGRTGAVAAQAGDYAAGQVTNAADLSSAAVQVFTGNLRTPLVNVLGITGATSGVRLVGGTVSGAPVSGTFVVGDAVIDESGRFWICTVGGTPGTWLDAGPVKSVFGRSGAVVATAGDYTAAQVTNAADLSNAAAQVFAGNVQAPALIPSGLTGSVQATRFVGATVSGAPTTGAHLVGDWVVAQNGHMFVCTVAGTPGTWVDVAAGVSPTATNGTAALAADVTLTPVNTFVSAVNTGAIGAAGQVWLLTASISFLSTTSGHVCTARLTDGTTVFADAEIVTTAAIASGCSLSVIVTQAAAATYTLQGASNTGAVDLIKATNTANATAGVATRISWVRLA